MARYFLTAEVFSGKEAFEMGLIHGFGDGTVMEELSQKVRCAL